MKKYFGLNVPSVGELERRTSLALVNTNPVLDYTFPTLPNVITVGGVHIKNPKEIPKVICHFKNIVMIVNFKGLCVLGFEDVYRFVK